jgi:hypothetical protein
MDLPKSVVKEIAPKLVAELSASQPTLRDAASLTLATMIGSVGDRALGPYLSKAEDARATKVGHPHLTLTCVGATDTY